MSSEVALDREQYQAPRLWFKTLSHLSRDSRRVAWAGMLLVPTFWLLDAAIDVYLFGAGEYFHHGIFDLEPVELYMRCLVSVMFVVFGFYAAFLLDRSERIEQQLRDSNSQLHDLKEALERLVAVDPLTGTFNRRKFHDLLQIAISNAERHDRSFALLLMDIDHFKKINDTYGHPAGDRVLLKVCELILQTVRGGDQLFRVGGEEFCLLVPSTSAADVCTLAEKLRQVVEGFSFDEIGRVTISVGVAHFREGDSQELIFARADEAMYSAKRKGRNCIECES